MKQIYIRIFFFFCLVIPIATTFSYLHIQKKSVKKKVKREIIASLDKVELVLLKFHTLETKLKLRWEHSREFEYSGNMYDIVATEFQGDSVHYWCWLDSEETKLNKHLIELVNNILGSDSKNSDKQQKLIDFYKKIIKHNESSSKNFSNQIDTKSFFYYCNIIKQFYPPPIPPPRFC